MVANYIVIVIFIVFINIYEIGAQSAWVVVGLRFAVGKCVVGEYQTLHYAFCF